MKSSLKKVFLTAILISCMLLPGCTESKPVLSPDNSVSVIVWHYYNGKQKEAFDQLVSQFNETVGAEKGVVVTAESKGNVDDLAAAVTDSAEKKVGSDDLPDIFATYADTAYVINQMGMLADISQYMTDKEMEGYVPAFLDEGKLTKDQLLVFPVAKSTELLYVNQTDWEVFAKKTDVSTDDLTTWEGLAEVAEKYYNWSGGKAFFGRDAFPNYLIIGSRQLGKEIFEVKDGNVAIQLDEAVMRRLWDYYAVPYLKGYYGAYGRFRSDDVKTGDLIAFVGSTSSTSYYPTEVTRDDGSTYPIEGAVYPLPNFKDTDSYAVQQGAGMSIIKSDQQREMASVEFLKWFTNEEQNTAFSVNSGYLPVKLSANSTENMENALNEANVDPDSLIRKSTLMGIDAVHNVNLYTNKPFDGGVAARVVLTDFMTDKLDEYKEEIALMDTDDIDSILDDYFKQWLSDLKKALNV